MVLFTIANEQMREPYPLTEPIEIGHLDVSDLHSIYYEVSGNPDGIPVIHIHGGPGSASKPKYRQLYNPKKYKIILFDQRGCGKSRPRGELKENTTQDLVEDMEKLRKHLGIDKLIINGASWGSAVALEYALKYTKYVKSIILRGVFLGGMQQAKWLTEYGANILFPDLWERVMVEFEEDDDLIESFSKKINEYQGEDLVRLVEAWNGWEGNLLKLQQEHDFEKITIEEAEESRYSINIFIHYIQNNCFIDEQKILRSIDKIRDIPAVIINGRYDVISGVKTAWDLHKAWSEADFYLLEDAGHHGSEPSILDKTIEYTDKFAES